MPMECDEYPETSPLPTLPIEGEGFSRSQMLGEPVENRAVHVAP